MGVTGALNCAHRATTALSCELCEQEERSACSLAASEAARCASTGIVPATPPPFFSILLKCPLGNLIELIEINRVQSALCRLSRLAALGKELDGTSLSFLFALKQSRRWIDLDERDAFRNGKGHDR